MYEDIRTLITGLWKSYSCSVTGITLGALLGIAILLFGFWNTVFVVICSLIGLFVGLKIDHHEDVFGKLRQFLPDYLNRWR